MSTLLEMLIDFITVLYPPLSAILLVLGTVLFGFCSYVFFTTGGAGGGVIFAVLALACLALLIAGLANGWFQPRRSRRSGKK